jgi:branched-chain amino acid aminotransferase
MSIRVHVNGRVCEPATATIPVFDRGFLYGDSVYETVGTVGGSPFALDEHLDRLERSAHCIMLRLPARAEIARAVAETLAAAANEESRIRIIVTRGGDADGRFDLDPGRPHEPRLVVIVQPLGGPTPTMRADGVAVAIVAVSRNQAGAVDPTVKSGNYLSSVLALGEARRRFPDVYEAILSSPDGSVAEGATSNVFLVARGVVRTPALDVGILDGITRRKVLAVAREAGFPVDEGRISPDELRGADEAFITSSARGVLPVTRVDGRPIGDGRPGPITRALAARYDALAHLHAER